MHSSASTDSLLSGLDFLSRSIEKKSASLKVLVEANFERFVGAKATIDRVYSEMRADGQEVPEPPPSPSRRPGHSRGTSLSSFSARPRGASATLTPHTVAQINGEKKKNALVKESEYGVHGIKVPLTEVAVKAEEVWGPALGGKDKEDTLKEILSSVEKNRGLFEVGSAIQDAIRRKDHETIVEEYTRARKFAEDTRYIVEQASYSKTPLTDSQIHQIIVTARMWADVEHQIEAFKRDSWKRLTSTHFSRHETGLDQAKEQYMELISIMLELGVEDSPIWVWLLSRYEHLRKRLLENCDRARMEIEYLRRLLGNQPKPGLKTLLKHLRAVPTNSKITAEPAKLDTSKTIEFWEYMNTSVTSLLAANGGILGEIVEYWDIALSFVDGQAQKSLPMGFNNQSSVHHKLSPGNVTELEKGITELVNIIREHLFSFFAEPPIEDITSLYSPLPTSPTPTTPRTPMSAALSPTMGSKFRFDPNSAPPPSPKRGDAWEKYAFWPPHSNALSGSHYLAKSLLLIGTAANELASLRLKETGSTVRLDETLRVLVGGVRERCVQAVCAAWNTDAESLKVLEDWTRDADRKDITTMPTRFLAVQSFLLNNLQKIMYVEASSKTAVDVLVPPSSKLLQMVRSQFVTSLYRTLSGMVECAEKGRTALGKDFEIKSDDLTVDDEEAHNAGWGKVDASKRVSVSPCACGLTWTAANNCPVHPPPPHPLQHDLLPNRNHPPTNHPLPKPLLRLPYRRIQENRRRSLPARRPALQILQPAPRRPHRRHHRARHLLALLGPTLGTRQICRRSPAVALCLRHPPRPRPCPHRGQHHLAPTHRAHPARPLRSDYHRSHQDVQRPAPVKYKYGGAHAGDAGRGVHGADAGELYD